MEEFNIPKYRAKKTHSDEYVVGYIAPLSSSASIFYMYAIEETCDTIKAITIKWFEEIDPSTLEISDGKKWRKLSDCSFMTNDEIDTRLQDKIINKGE
jgi:hypothetical protein